MSRQPTKEFKPNVVAVVGPTASGKTALGIALAKKFNGEIISTDSRQVYRGMDIGTAKAEFDAPKNFEWTRMHSATTVRISNGIAHHLVDIRNPDEEYTVADFKRDATAAIREIISRKKLPIIVGGTGLYVKALIDNWEIPATKANPALRRKIDNEIAERGLDAVFKKLVALDPEAAYVVDPKNPRRIVRALEVALVTGKPFTASRVQGEAPYRVLEIGINPPAGILRERIDRRVDEMMHAGLVAEVKNLLKKYGRAPIAFDAIGYREIIDYLEGKCTEAEAVAAMKLNTWHFAKRQLTWFKKDKQIRWVHNATEAEHLVADFMKK